MRTFRRIGWLRFLCLGLCGLSFAPQCVAQAQANDEAAVRAVVERYYAVYAQKDLNATLAWWDQQAPDFMSEQKAISDLFMNFDIRLNNFRIVSAKVEGDQASVRTAFDLALTQLKKQDEKITSLDK